MPAASKLGDKCSGHGPYPPRAGAEASQDVFINGSGAHRDQDEWLPHGHTHPPDRVIGGSSTVFINGKPAVRIADDITCGSVVAEGSSNVFIGD